MHTLTKHLIAPAVAVLLLSCKALPTVQAQQTEAVTPPVARLIVKLHVPTDESTVMRLIRQTLPRPERVTYLRAMSGDAHVLGVVAPATAESVPALIAELEATNLFEYVELDRMKSIRGNP